MLSQVVDFYDEARAGTVPPALDLEALDLEAIDPEAQDLEARHVESNVPRVASA